jgi:hypothetical protein
MPIPLVAVPLVKAAIELALLGSLAEIAAFALPVVVAGALVAGAVYHVVTEKEVSQIRQRAIQKFVLVNPTTEFYQTWIRGNKYNSSPVSGFPESKGRYSEFYANRRDKYSVIQQPYTYTYKGVQTTIYFDKVIRNGNQNDSFRYAEPGQTYFDNVSDDFFPGSVVITLIEKSNWDGLPQTTRKNILNSLSPSDWEAIIQGVPETGVLKTGDVLKNPVFVGEPFADNPSLRTPRQTTENIVIPVKPRLPNSVPPGLAVQGVPFRQFVPPDSLPQSRPESIDTPKKEPPKDSDDMDAETKGKISAINDKLDIMLPFFPALMQRNNPLDMEQTITAAKEGVCRSTNPGGCMNKALSDSENRINANGKANTGNILDAVNTAQNAAQLKLLQGIDTKLGPELANGGISGFLTNFLARFNKVANWLHLDRALNVLIWWQTLHNAYMLSNNLGQTLTSAISNVLSAVGIKDAEGSPLDIGDIIGDTLDGIAKKALGEETWGGIKAEWKKYNRIYQAGANILNSVQSIGHSVLGALNVVGSWNASIGNALRKWGTVGENAYRWMNPNVNFQNRFFVGLEAATNAVSQVDQIASEVLSVQENVKQIGEQSKELQKSLGQDDDSKQSKEPPEADKIKREVAASKAVSKGPEISDSDKEADE